jgi:hypothetical protein
MKYPQSIFAAPSFVATLRGVKRFLHKVDEEKKNPGSQGEAIRGGGYCC